MIKKTYETQLGGRLLKVEIGEMAKQAGASALIFYEETMVLSVVTASKKPSTMNFFPLMVLYQEKLYAAGKIPGGFLRREGRPSENETLTSRLIDRPIRPLFPEGYRNEIQVVSTVLSNDPTAPAEMAAMFGSSLVLCLSDIPFDGPIAGVTIGKIDGEYLINPTKEELEKSTMNLTLAGTIDGINMVEAAANQVSEKEMLEALAFGHDVIRKLIAFQKEILKDFKVTKLTPEIPLVEEKIRKAVLKFAEKDLHKAISINEKLARQDAIDLIFDKTKLEFEKTNFIKDLDGIKVEDVEKKKAHMFSVHETLDEIVKLEVRRLITKDKIRPDGRKTDEIRPLTSRVDVLPRTHGSALFTRGQTQSLSVVTLGSLGESQIIDDLSEKRLKRFMLQYNFPQFSVGETGRYGAPGRREIGHGALGERAILQVLPNEEEFPYAIRLVSEILESNGSSSQASICAGTMALMAAGVPLLAPVAGIAMGLITDGKNYTILTDIQGMEDHLGDMDFKVAGTVKGITALQMDIKVTNLSHEILGEALMQAQKGRLEILAHMIKTIPSVRPELSRYAPKVRMMRIDPDKIRDVIGPGGKIITQIIEDNNNVKIDIEQDGRVFIMHEDIKWIESAMARIQELTKEAKVNEIYDGLVKRVEAYGAFVELWEGVEGMVHISQLDEKRVEKVEDVVKIGDRILVKVIKIDDRGRIDLSRKAALKDKE